jgi:hypothetical protein
MKGVTARCTQHKIDSEYCFQTCSSGRSLYSLNLCRLRAFKFVDEQVLDAEQCDKKERMLNVPAVRRLTPASLTAETDISEAGSDSSKARISHQRPEQHSYMRIGRLRIAR